MLSFQIVNLFELCAPKVDLLFCIAVIQHTVEITCLSLVSVLAPAIEGFWCSNLRIMTAHKWKTFSRIFYVYIRFILNQIIEHFFSIVSY